MSVLADILASKARDVEELRAQDLPTVRHAPADVALALCRAEGDPLRLIAEVKFKSPSAGALSRKLDAASRAAAYARAGASMVSVLCDAPFFDGAWEDLAAARARSPELLLLAKEFVIDEVQIAAARAYGADAVLLIARIVSPARLSELARSAREARLEPLIEVTEEGELAAAIDAGARVIGVNARDLDTLAIDVARAARVLAAIPREIVAVHLSGLKTPEDVRAVDPRADAALIGEALMREDDPAPLLAKLVAAANRA